MDSIASQIKKDNLHIDRLGGSNNIDLDIFAKVDQ